MKRTVLVLVCALACSLLFGCKNKDKDGAVVVQQVSAFKPNLPPVPTIPKPTVPETYSDGSYTVYGVRKRIAKTVDTQVTVTAYVAKLYEKPVCAEGQTCFTFMPHLWLADEANETLQPRMLRLVGYARSFQEMEEQKEKDEKGEVEELPEGVYLPPIIWDWRIGHKYKVTGQFTRHSGEGFMDETGLLSYSSQQCLDCPVEEPEEGAAAKK